VPHALLHNLNHNKVLHERNVVLTVVFRDVPWVAPEQRVQVQALGHDFWRVTLHFGFMDTPDVPQALKGAEAQGLRVPLADFRAGCWYRDSGCKWCSRKDHVPPEVRIVP
jgi:KUP system potassium uptake protein